MKKIIIPAVLLLALFSACKEVNYVEQIEGELNGFSDYYCATLQDAELTDEQKDANIDAKYDEVCQKIADLAAAGLKKHSNDSVALKLVMALEQSQVTDPEGMLSVINKLGPQAQEFEQIKHLKSLYEKKILTAEGTMFLDFEAVQPDGSIAKLSDYAGKGKYCLVDFWASWCGPCKREIPNIREVYETFGPKGLVVVSVAVWDRPEDTLEAAAEHGVVWNQIVNAQKVPTELYAIQGIPHIMLIGPDGTILKRDLRGADIRKEVEKYL